MKIAGSIEKKYLILDIGTSDIKCGCFDANHNILSLHHQKFPMSQNQGTFEIDFNLFFNTASDLLKKVIAEQFVERSTIGALLITSQAQTFTAVDADFQPLCNGIVWLDERAENEALYLKERLPDFVKASGFNRPLPSLYVSKLLWLKNHESPLFKKARAFPLINEYLAYKLTDEFYSDSTSFGMSGMYDFRHNGINPEILSILGLTKVFFPKIEKAAVKCKLISKHIQQAWELNYRFPVFLCGNDQGASACGAGLKQVGDVNINFGTAMVFYTITEFLQDQLSDNQIAGKHPVGDDFFLLNVEGDFGIEIRRLKDKLFKHGTYDQLFQTYYQYPDVKAKTPFKDDGDMSFISQADSYRFCAGIIKYYLARLKTHYSHISQAVPLKNIFLSGGMMQSKVWNQIVQDALIESSTVANRANAGLYGALVIYLHNKNRRIGND
jgi:sugar (pentulose or hexulose) kinase